MARNCFVREEGLDRLVLCSGLPPAWYEQPATLSFGPAPTSCGPVSISVRIEEQAIAVSWSGQWRTAAPSIEVRLPGYACVRAAADKSQVIVKRHTEQVIA